MPKMRSKDDLLAEFEATAAEYFDAGRSCNIADIALTIAVIVTSLIAAIVAATDISKWIRVGIATVPAACTSIQKVIDVRGRSNWYFRYAARLRALVSTAEFSANQDLQTIAGEKAAIDLDMEKVWTDVGRKRRKPRTSLGHTS